MESSILAACSLLLLLGVFRQLGEHFDFVNVCTHRLIRLLLLEQGGAATRLGRGRVLLHVEADADAYGRRTVGVSEAGSAAKVRGAGAARLGLLSHRGRFLVGERELL